MESSNTQLLVPPEDDQVQVDYDAARKNLQTILATGTKALEQLAVIAEESQHPRTFEVLATLIKNLGEVNDRLLGIQLDKQALDNENMEVSENQVLVNNAVFVGTTAELLELTKKPPNKLLK